MTPLLLLKDISIRQDGICCLYAVRRWEFESPYLYERYQLVFSRDPNGLEVMVLDTYHKDIEENVSHWILWSTESDYIVVQDAYFGRWLQDTRLDLEENLGIL